VTLERPAVFEIAPNTGSLKESVQKGQQLVWHPTDKPDDRRFQITNMSVAFLREQTGGQVKMTFTGNISSLGYLTSEEAKLNVNVRARGGASLHSWSLEISVKSGPAADHCGRQNRGTHITEPWLQPCSHPPPANGNIRG
jgi:hypothetical protein